MSMKKLFVLVSVVLMGAGVFAYTFTGTPTAGLNQGQWKAGYNYTYFDDDAELQRHYFDLGAGLADSLELNLLLGVTNLEVDDFESNGDFSWGFNAKWSFIDAETIDWGVLYQMTWWEGDDSVGGVKAETDNIYDIQLAVGPTIDMGGWKLYGGGVYLRTDGDLKVGGVDLDAGDDDDFGGFIGAEFGIMENADVALEYATIGGGNVFGAGINFKF